MSFFCIRIASFQKNADIVVFSSKMFVSINNFHYICGVLAPESILSGKATINTFIHLLHKIMTNNLYLPTASSGGQCRTWSLRLLLLTVIVAFFIKAQAQYELVVYSSNLQHKTYTTSTSNATSASLKSGSIEFNSTTGQVTLNNVVFENTATGVDGGFIALSANNNSGAAAKIVVKGTNNVSSGGQRPIRLTNIDATFQRVLASGYDETNCILDINCTSSNAYGISLNNSSMFVSNCTVKVQGGQYGISGEHQNSYEKLSTTHAIIYAKGGTASIGRLGGMELGNGSQIRRPAGAAFSSSLHGVALNGSLVTDEVLICDNNYVEPGDTEPPTVGTLSFAGYTSSSVSLKWTEATDNETSQANLRYRLRYKKNDDSSWSTAFDFQKGITEYTVQGLDYDTRYNFLLTVCDEAGNTADYTQRTTSTAVLKYDLKVGGVEVTSRNAGDITSDQITSGKASYDPETYTLTLDNVVIDGEGHTLLTYSTHPGLNIKLVGENSITNSTISTVALWGNSRIYGSGSLTLRAPESASSAGIFIYKESTLTIDETTIDARGGYGIEGQTCLNSKLIINKSNVRAYGKKRSLAHFYSVTLNDCYVSQPSNGYYRPEVEAMANGNGAIISEEDVVIEPCKIYVGGKGLAPGATTTDIFAGKASLDSEGKTLTLDNAAIVTSGDVPGIQLGEIEDFTIKIIGNNAIEADNTGILASYITSATEKAKLSIVGPGVLDIWAKNSSNGIGVSINFCDLIISNSNVIIDGHIGVDGTGLAFLY